MEGVGMLKKFEETKDRNGLKAEIQVFNNHRKM